MGDRGTALIWIEAASDTEIAAELEAVFEDAAAAIRERGPVCWASGRCCHFEEAGHRLYVTGLEAAYTLVRHGRGEAQREADSGRRLTILGADRPLRSTLDLSEIEAARRAGGCPFQAANLCGAHEIKPLGCRLYFCDRTAQQWQHDLHERLLGDIRSLHERRHLPYLYCEWREALSLVAPALSGAR